MAILVSGGSFIEVSWFILRLSVVVVIVREVVIWLRNLYLLRNIPHPKERYPFSLFMDVLYAMRNMKVDPKKQLDEKTPPSKSAPANNTDLVNTKTELIPHKSNIPRKFFLYVESIFPFLSHTRVLKAYYGPKPFLLVFQPNVVEGVLSNSENINKSFLYSMMHPWLGNGLLTSEKQKWRRRRRVLNPAFHFRTLDHYVPTMNRRACHLVEKLTTRGTGGAYIDILPVFRLTTFGILFETAMGINLDDNENEGLRFLTINDRISSSIMSRMCRVHHWPDFIYRQTRTGKQFFKDVQYIKQYTTNILRTRKENYNSDKVDKNSQSFMDILLRLHMEENSLTEDEIREEVNTFMIGGFDTTATAAAFAVFLLGCYPEAQRRVHQELDAIFVDDPQRPITMQDVREMKYLDCVIKETLRLFPPIPIIAREIDQECVIEGHRIPRGVIALVVIYYLHRNPSVYSNPDNFEPERFLENSKPQHPFAYIPFAAGARNCIGQKFAQMEDKILLAHIMRNFTVKSRDPLSDVKLALELVLRPDNGLWVTFTKRTST